MLKKGMGKSILMTVLITGNVIWGGTVVYAEEGLQQFNLDQMVVTATRTMKELQEVPSSVSVVTSQDIEERNINSVHREGFRSGASAPVIFWFCWMGFR